MGNFGYTQTQHKEQLMQNANVRQKQQSLHSKHSLRKNLYCFIDANQQSSINGSFTQKGNYVWGGALTLACKQLINDLIKQPIVLMSHNIPTIRICDNFNNSPFNSTMLSESCYYAKSGFGNATVQKINQQVRNKFTDKITPQLEMKLQPNDIISYGYFLKKLQFMTPFDQSFVVFKSIYVPGFSASKLSQKLQVLVWQYNDEQNFVIQLKSKKVNDHIFIIKSGKKQKPQQVIQEINKMNNPINNLKDDQIFQMPKISLSHRREIQKLCNIRLANRNWQSYRFGKIYQIIKINLDETGIRVENEGVIGGTYMCVAPIIKRKFIIDKPFWILMRQNQNYPYLLSYITDINDI